MELQQELKEKILKALNLEDIKPEDIDDETPLFGDEGVGLDSIDVLELIEKDYGIRIKDPKAGKDVFKNIHTMAEFVSQNRKK